MAGSQTVRLAFRTYETEPAWCKDEAKDETLGPVIFCHGAGASKENWGDIPQNIANFTERRVYSLDARNHGDSEWSDVFNFDILADDLIQFMESHDIRKAVLVGHSMGGITVMKTALKRPELADKVVVEDIYTKKVPKPILDGCVSYFNLAQKAMEAAPSDLGENELKKFVMSHIHSNLPQEVKDQLRGENESEDDHIANFKRDEDGRLVFKANLAVIAKAMRDEEAIMTEYEGVFKGPTCFIYGELSPFKVGEEADHIKQFFPNVVLNCIDNATHAVHGERPTEFTNALRKFLS